MRAGCLLTLFFLLVQILSGQNPVQQAISNTNEQGLIVTHLSEKEYKKLSQRYKKLTKRIKKGNEKFLAKAYAIEKSLRQYDSLGFTDKDERIYTSIKKQILNADSLKFDRIQVKEYLPKLDSLQAAILFLQMKANIYSPALKQLGIDLNLFQQHWQNAIQLQSFLRDRRNELRSNLPNLGQVAGLQSLNKELVYYQQQLNEFRNYLRSPDQLALRLITIARSDTRFAGFLQQNSILSQFFSIPGQQQNQIVLNGLQTRSSVQNQLSAQLGGPIQEPSQYLQAQLQVANNELNKLKDKINEIGGGSSDFEQSSFKPNSQKTKTFFRRIEWGMNIQSQRPNTLLPVTSDIALSVGYKLNDKSTVGFGAGYKLGWGKNFSNIRFSSEGASIRSFADIKIKGQIWVTGGYEYNYQQSFARISDLQNRSAWQKSGLIGMTKKYKIGKKEGKLQLLWDFLSYAQVPQTQPLKFRIGYQF